MKVQLRQVVGVSPVASALASAPAAANERCVTCPLRTKRSEIVSCPSIHAQLQVSSGSERSCCQKGEEHFKSDGGR